MPNPDDGGYTPTRFQVYLNGKPVGGVYHKESNAQSFAGGVRTNHRNGDIEVVALDPDEDPKDVVIPGYPHKPGPSVNVSDTESKLPQPYHVIFGKLVLGFGDGEPLNIFSYVNATDIRRAMISDLTLDGTMPLEEAQRLVKVVQVGDG